MWFLIKFLWYIIEVDMLNLFGLHVNASLSVVGVQLTTPLMKYRLVRGFMKTNPPPSSPLHTVVSKIKAEICVVLQKN